jgi:hypothetical protein
VDTRHPLIQTIATMVNTGPGISGIRFSDNTINGIRISDAYIYTADVERSLAAERHMRRSHPPM